MDVRSWVTETGPTIWKVQPSGIRTALAVTVPLFVGQAIGRDELGLLVGLGGLYVCIADKFGANVRDLVIATACAALAALCGSAIAPHAALAIGAIFVWAFLCGLLGVFGDLIGNIGFMATIVFSVALGLPPLPHFVSEAARAACIALGGTWSALMSGLLWKLTGMRSAAPPPGPELVLEEPPLRRLIANLTLTSSVFQHALRIAISTFAAVALYKGFHIEHGYWLTITVLVIVKPDFAATRLRAGERVFGSIVGGAVGILVVALVHNKLALDVLLVLFCIIAYSHSQTNYGVFSTFLTPFVVLLINMAGPSNWRIALVRIMNTVIGGALALIVAYLLRPREKMQGPDVPNASSPG